MRPADTEHEQWREVVGDHRYVVSSLGRVYSRRASRCLKPAIASNGYPTVCLGRGNTRTLHSLVAGAFLGTTPEGQEIRHRDGIRANPQLSNLEFGTRADNIHDAVEHGTWDGAGRCETIRAMRTAESFAKTWATRRERYGASGRP